MKFYTQDGSEITGVISADIDSSDIDGLVTAQMVVVVDGFGRVRARDGE